MHSHDRCTLLLFFFFFFFNESAPPGNLPSSPPRPPPDLAQFAGGHRAPQPRQRKSISTRLLGWWHIGKRVADSAAETDKAPPAKPMVAAVVALTNTPL